MPAVKKILCGLAVLALGLLLALPTDPTGPGPSRPAVPARADLAEAVFTMIAARAAEAGLPRPTTLCEACTAAALDLPAATRRQHCRQACGLP